MGETIDAVFSAPLANILVVAGIVFLLVAVLGTVAGKIDPGKGGRIAAGAIGLVLIGGGLSMHLIVGKISDSDKREKEELRTQEEARRITTEEASQQQTLDDALRKATEKARQQALEEARLKAAEEARQQAALDDALRKAAEKDRQQALEEARLEAAEKARQQAALEKIRRQATEAKPSNSCDSIRIPEGATCSDFYAERSNWGIGRIRKCGRYQVRRYKEALNIRSQPEWGRFLRPCK